MSSEIIFLDGYPVHEHPRTPPRVVTAVGKHMGEVLGIKGRYMIFRDPAGVYSMLDLSDLPSRLVDVSDIGSGSGRHQPAPKEAAGALHHPQSTLDI